MGRAQRETSSEVDVRGEQQSEAVEKIYEEIWGQLDAREVAEDKGNGCTAHADLLALTARSRHVAEQVQQVGRRYFAIEL